MAGERLLSLRESSYIGRARVDGKRGSGSSSVQKTRKVAMKQSESLLVNWVVQGQRRSERLEAIHMLKGGMDR